MPPSPTPDETVDTPDRLPVRGASPLAPAAAQGAASLWPESTRGALPAPDDTRPEAGPPPALPAPLPGPGPGSAFDVCHVGVVLRAVLFVQGVVALGVPYGAADLDAGLVLFARGSIVALWGTLVWLVAGCAGKRWLAALPVPGQWVAAVTLGALAAGSAWSLLWFSGLTETPLQPVAWPPVASGAAIAAALFYWLRLRALARPPADANARLAELQSRIRPHFLFNTLNTAVTLVRVDPARAEAVLEDLAALFRVALQDSGDSASLAEEVELAQRYLEIEQLRFGDRLRVVWEIEPQAEAARLPPLLLQPLVENAVRHGIEPLRDGGEVRVRARRRHGHVEIDIVNPIGPRQAASGHGIALSNVRERLRLMHDVAARFEARRDGSVFRVQLVVPL